MNMCLQCGKAFAAISCLLLSASPVSAHVNCGHPGQPACADGWSSGPTVVKPTIVAVGGAKPDPAVEPVQKNSSCTTGSEMRQWCAAVKSAGFLHLDTTNACDGWLPGQRGGKIPESEGCTPVVQEAAVVGGSAVSLNGWRHSDRWGDPNSPGFIDFANNKTININPAIGGKYNPLSYNADGSMRLTARRITDGSLNGTVAAKAADQGQDPNNVTWAGGWITTPGGSEAGGASAGDVRPGDTISADIRTSDVAHQGAGFWLYGQSDQSAGANYTGANEIDIFDKPGVQGQVQATVHDGHELSATVWNANPGEWHNYGFKRSADGNTGTLLLDGKPQGTVSTPGFKGPMHPILSIAGDNYGSIPSGIDSVTMDVRNLKKN